MSQTFTIVWTLLTDTLIFLSINFLIYKMEVISSTESNRDPKITAV